MRDVSARSSVKKLSRNKKKIRKLKNVSVLQTGASEKRKVHLGNRYSFQLPFRRDRRQGMTLRKSGHHLSDIIIPDILPRRVRVTVTID